VTLRRTITRLVAVLAVSFMLVGTAPAWSQTSGNPGAGPGEQNNSTENPGGQRSPGSDTGRGSTEEGSNPVGFLVAVLVVGAVVTAVVVTRGQRRRRETERATGHPV
jgi:hypothetical protein